MFLIVSVGNKFLAHGEHYIRVVFFSYRLILSMFQNVRTKIEKLVMLESIPNNTKEGNISVTLFICPKFITSTFFSSVMKIRIT